MVNNLKLKELLIDFPWIEDFFISHSLNINNYLELTFTDIVNDIDTNNSDYFSEKGTTKDQFLNDFIEFIRYMKDLLKENKFSIESITIESGFDKKGSREKIGLTLKPGEITAIVGPTGSGKSRLLEDIECLAQRDTPTGRQILINGNIPNEELRFSTGESIIAQLSQNMNFVMDLSVKEFLTIHGESRMVDNISSLVEKIFTTANELSGEPFSIDAPITGLSGGQSRALMIADTALLSRAPIILIDEIENAGVDKIKALELLISNNKIVLISTHDPVLALSSEKRVVIKNGGIDKVIKTKPEEKEYLKTLRKIDESISCLRQRLRLGEEIINDGAMNSLL